MILAVDVGNTNIVFAVFDGEIQLSEWRCQTSDRRTADEYGVWLLTLMQHAGLQASQIKACVVGSVVPGATFNLKRLCKSYLGLDAVVLGEPGGSIPIEAKIDTPSQAGVDRLVNAFEAYARKPQAQIVLDFGTATTFDFVSEDGAYCGGAFAPGINLSVKALYQVAARLPRVTVAKPQKVIGKSTVAAMQSGIFWGYISLIEGLVQRMRDEYAAEQNYSGPISVLATGGLAVLFDAHTDIIDEIDPQLTLRGIKRVYETLYSD